MPHLNDNQAITETVTRFFQAVDARDWETFRALITDPVDISHGSDPTTFSREELTTQWKESHTKYTTTQYRLEPVGVELTTEGRATARFHARLTFLLPETTEEPNFVKKGYYTVDLERPRDTWKIRTLRFDETDSHDAQSDNP